MADADEVKVRPRPRPRLDADTRPQTTYDVDVIILSWKRIDDTIAAVESALRQRHVRVAVQILDQGSSSDELDQLRAFAQERANVFLRESATNTGVPGGRNIATDMGRAPIVVGLDNDAEFASETSLATAKRILEGDASLGAIGFRILVYETRKDDWTSFGYPAHFWVQRDRPFFPANFIGAGHAYKRSVFDKAGGYDPRLFFGGEERDLGFRILNLGYRIRYSPEVEILHKVSPEARVSWDGGRYYYHMRNTIFTNVKAGLPWSRTTMVAGGMVIRGVRNGRWWDVARASVDAAKLALTHRPTPGQRQVERMSPVTVASIADIYRWNEMTFLARLRRIFSEKKL